LTKHARKFSEQFMARIILVTGGARSGKSRYAESLYEPTERVVYIATSRIEDEEMQARIQQHRRSRPQTWQTFEATDHLYQATEGEPQTLHYLLDCLSVLTANILFDLTRTYEKIPDELQKTVEDTVIHEIELLIQNIKAMDGCLVMVTNEVGSSIVPENHVARVYRDILGRVNQCIAALCSEVYLVTCGIPLRLK
jgi:adenosylcobinamide kinase/adenosylcobinamide-phosphate guanylyltransferase